MFCTFVGKADALQTINHAKIPLYALVRKVTTHDFSRVSMNSVAICTTKDSPFKTVFTFIIIEANAFYTRK